jgi:membrane protein required for beta-lactamase induction
MVMFKILLVNGFTLNFCVTSVLEGVGGQGVRVDFHKYLQANQTYSRISRAEKREILIQRD